MRLPDRTRSVVDALDQREESTHFIIHYRLRNPPRRSIGRGVGAEGVRSRYLIASYIKALEALWRTFESLQNTWIPPKTDETGRIHVYIFYLPILITTNEAYTTVDSNLVPYICLPCRSGEPILQNALYRGEVEAVHEATHVFCWSWRPPLSSFVDSRWQWFNEATAVFMEGLVLPGNLDSIRFGLDWNDFPHVSLDRQDMEYQSGFFLRYLAARFQPSLIARTWQECLPNETPLDTLNRLLPAGQRSLHSNICTIFGEYAHDSFFTWDPRCAGFAPELYLRFGVRALTETFMLEVRETAQTHDTVDHLACRYYRIECSHAVSKLRVQIQVDCTGGDGFRCFVSTCHREGHRGLAFELMSGGENISKRRIFSGELYRDDLMTSDYIIVTVANCGTRSVGFTALGEPHDDDRLAAIEIEAE